MAALLAAVLVAGALLALTRPPGAALPRPAAWGALPPASPPPPGSLLAAVIAAHGGAERWREVERVRVKLRFGGLAFRMRFAEPAPEARWVELDVRAPRSVWSDYPEPGQRGFFSADRVWIEDAEGRLLRSLERPREKLLASRRRQLWWDALDLLYFAGYASWNYLQGPFLLLQPGVEARELEPWQEEGKSWRRLAVRFPDALPTHSREQVFYFGPDLRQRRHDYTPDVFASWAGAAHLVSDYRELGGLQLATRRRVVPRRGDGRAAAGPTLVWIEVSELELLRRGGGSAVPEVSAPPDARDY